MCVPLEGWQQTLDVVGSKKSLAGDIYADASTISPHASFGPKRARTERNKDGYNLQETRDLITLYTHHRRSANVVTVTVLQ